MPSDRCARSVYRWHRPTPRCSSASAASTWPPVASAALCVELFQRKMPPADMDVPEPGEQPVDLWSEPGHHAPVAEGRRGHHSLLLARGESSPHRLHDVLQGDGAGRTRQPAHPDQGLGHDERALNPKTRPHPTMPCKCVAFMSGLFGASRLLAAETASNSIESVRPELATPGHREETETVQ